MKKLTLLLLLIVCYCSALWAQTVSLGLPVSGSGSTNVLLSTSTTGNLYSKTISVYTAAEIITAGGSAGNITALAWDKQGTGEYQFGNAQMIVYFKHVTNSSWATAPDFALEASSATQVFNSSTYSLPVGVGWAPLTFTAPFAWNGTDNIAVLVDWYRPSTPTAAINWGRSVVTSANATRVGSSLPLPVLLINNNRPVIQLVFGSGPSCATPTGLAATGITATGAALNWNTVAGAAGYEYSFSTTPALPATGTPTAATSHNPGVLTPSTTYYMHVRAQCGASTFSGWATTSFTTSAAPCAAPATPVISPITMTSATVNWTAVTGAIGYQYAVNSSPTPPGAGTAIVNTTLPLPGLTAGTTYYVHIRTDCGGSNFSPWTTTSFTTPFPPCSPSTPVVSNITSATADINWFSVPGTLSYEYEVNTSSTPPAAGTSTTATTYNASGLTPATAYYAHLRVFCAGSQISPWTTVPFTTFSPCDTPVPAVTNIKDTSADIGWPAVTGAVGYQYAVTITATPPAAGTPTTLTALTAGSLTALNSYYLHVRTDCGGGNFSPWVTRLFNTAAACGAPAAAITNITSSSADIAWPAVTGALSYEYAVDNSATPPTGAGTSTTTLLYNAGGLSAGTTYYAHLRSICAAIPSAWSSTSFVTQFQAGITPVSGNMGVEVYPNPANDHIIILASEVIKEIQVYNMTGAQVLKQPVDARSGTIQVSGLAAGVYNIRLQTEKGPINRQISIIR